MTLELRIEQAGGDVVRSNPTRDIAHFWPQLAALAVQGLLADNWEPWYRSWCQANRVHEGHLLRAMAAYVRALELSQAVDLRTPYAALEAAGFLQEPWPAQLVVVAKMGQLGTGAFWAGARSAHHAGEHPVDLQTLGRFATDARQVLAENWNAANK